MKRSQKNNSVGKPKKKKRITKRGKKKIKIERKTTRKFDVKRTTKATENRKVKTKVAVSSTKKAVYNDKDASSLKLDTLFSFEYLYFRNSELKRFEVNVNFPQLRVIDVSCNSLTDLRFLEYMPNVRHVFASCNKIGSFTNVSFIPSLETLGLSGNGIEDFDGFKHLPKLRVLNLMFNRLSDLTDFPELPALERINIIGNEVCENDGFKNMLIALTAQTSPRLEYINEEKITDREKQVSTTYRGKATLCARLGFLPDEESEEEFSQQVDDFLLEYNKEATQRQILSLNGHKVTGKEAEGHTLRYEMYFVCENPNAAIKPIKGLTRHMFQITSGSPKVDLILNDNVRLTMRKNPKAPKHVIIVYIPPGKYTYQYEYNGKTRSDLSEVEIEQEALDDEADDEADDEEKYDFYFEHGWEKYNTKDGFVNIDSADQSFEYVVQPNDMGHILKPYVRLFHMKSLEPLFEVFNYTEEIGETPPTVKDLRLFGKVVEGKTISAKFDYEGGEQGESIVKFYREGERVIDIKEGGNDPHGRGKNKNEYVLTAADIGKRIVCEVIPVRKDGKRGDMKRIVTAVIEGSVPGIEEYSIIGNLVEDGLAVVKYIFTGGIEGNTEFQWLRYNPETEMHDIEIGNERKIDLSVLDVGRTVKVKVIPKNDEGELGEIVEIESLRIAPSEPTIEDLKILINGEEEKKKKENHTPIEEGDILSCKGNYYGGVEGNSEIKWFRIKPKEEEEESEEEKEYIDMKKKKKNMDEHIVCLEDVGCFIGAEYTPIRNEDNVRGEMKIIKTTQKVVVSDPTCLSIELEEDKTDGRVLVCKTEYFGGKEGESRYIWERIGENNEIQNLKDSQENSYELQEEDADKNIRVTYIPKRSDGKESKISFSIISEKIL